MSDTSQIKEKMTTEELKRFCNYPYCYECEEPNCDDCPLKEEPKEA